MQGGDASERFIRAHHWLCKQFGLELVEVAPDMYVPLSASEHMGLDLRTQRQWEALDHPLSDAEKLPQPRPEPVKLFEVSGAAIGPLQPSARATTTVTAGHVCRPTQLRIVGADPPRFCVEAVGVDGPSTYALFRVGKHIELVVARDIWLVPGRTLWVEYINAGDCPGDFRAEVWGELRDDG